MFYRGLFGSIALTGGVRIDAALCFHSQPLATLCSITSLARARVSVVSLLNDNTALMSV
jgi:hypothetical protein